MHLGHLLQTCQEPGRSWCLGAVTPVYGRWGSPTAVLSACVFSFVSLSFIVWNSWCLPRIDFSLWNVSSKTLCLIFTHLAFLKNVIIFIEVWFAYHKIHPLKVYNSVLFRIFRELCNHHHYPILEHVYHCKMRPPYLLAVIPYFPLPQHLATMNLHSVCIDLPILNNWYKWNHTYLAFCGWLLVLSIMF